MLNRETILQVLHAAAKERCSFLVSVDIPTGGLQVIASAEDIAATLTDGLHLPSKLLGLTRHEYFEWLELDGHVRCCATTRQGQQCRVSASGKQMGNPAEWKALRATLPYCHVHGG
uniref:hypothetical protein n=1 Tax=Xanthomonas sp. 0924 TaxID=2835534 RepID=UPI003F82228B